MSIKLRHTLGTLQYDTESILQYSLYVTTNIRYIALWYWINSTIQFICKSIKLRYTLGTLQYDTLFIYLFIYYTLTSKLWNLQFIFDCHNHMQGSWIPVYWLTSQTTALVKFSVLIPKDLESSSVIGRLKLWTWRHPMHIIRC